MWTQIFKNFCFKKAWNPGSCENVFRISSRFHRIFCQRVSKNLFFPNVGSRSICLICTRCSDSIMPTISPKLSLRFPRNVQVRTLRNWSTAVMWNKDHSITDCFFQAQICYESFIFLESIIHPTAHNCSKEFFKLRSMQPFFKVSLWSFWK